MTFRELREDGGVELREFGDVELREGVDQPLSKRRRITGGGVVRRRIDARADGSILRIVARLRAGMARADGMTVGARIREAMPQSGHAEGTRARVALCFTGSSARGQVAYDAAMIEGNLLAVAGSFF